MLPADHYLMCDARDDVRDPFALDAEVEALCDDAGAWLAGVHERAGCVALTAAQWINLVVLPAFHAGTTEELWLVWCSCAAQALGLTLEQGLVAQVQARKPRLYTGYMPEQQRRAVRHNLYTDGIRKAPRKPTAADRALAEARAWGLA